MVTVSDTNDHNPVLACPPSARLACTFDVREDTAVNTVVVNSITSTDQDADTMHNTIRYSITNTPVPPFSIDRVSHSLTVIVCTLRNYNCTELRGYQYHGNTGL